jgi:hypothetical protein
VADDRLELNNSVVHIEVLGTTLREGNMFRRRQLRCSFCGKRETEVSKLVAGL